MAVHRPSVVCPSSTIDISSETTGPSEGMLYQACSNYSGQIQIYVAEAKIFNFKKSSAKPQGLEFRVHNNEILQLLLASAMGALLSPHSHQKKPLMKEKLCFNYFCYFVTVYRVAGTSLGDATDRQTRTLWYRSRSYPGIGRAVHQWALELYKRVIITTFCANVTMKMICKRRSGRNCSLSK